MTRRRKILAALAGLIASFGAVVALAGGGTASGCCTVNPTDKMWASQVTITTTANGYTNPISFTSVPGMPVAPYRAIVLELNSPTGGQPSLPYMTAVTVATCSFSVRAIDTTGHVFVGTATYAVEAMWSAEDPAPIGC